MHEILNVAVDVISALAALAQLVLQVRRTPESGTTEETDSRG
ncbi:hypothetical protein ACIPQH_34575 [Streptomyces rubiginosohelvolus]|nr:hypothetical protein [Streptomyces sp. 7G]